MQELIREPASILRTPREIKLAPKLFIGGYKMHFFLSSQLVSAGNDY